MASLKIKSVLRRFGVVAAVDRVSLEVGDGEFMALLGPSGCGKTTLLRLIAGFEVPDAGTIEIGGEVVAEAGRAVAPERRNLGMVFQSYALWPHLSVFGNVAYGLKVKGLKRKDLRDKVEAALELVDLNGYESRGINQLSGGQRQRVALARCLALDPRLVLLDEPLANLDAHLRETMQNELRRIQKQSGATFVFVTHDQSEAMSLADRIAVMDAGRIVQVSTPQELYRSPATEMVAGFIGRGTMLPARFLAAEGPGRGTVLLWGRNLEARFQEPPGQAECRVCVRSGDLALAADARGTAFSGTVRWVSFQGHAYLVGVAPEGIPDRELRLEVQAPPPQVGQTISYRFKDAWIVPQHG